MSSVMKSMSHLQISQPHSPRESAEDRRSTSPMTSPLGCDITARLCVLPLESAVAADSESLDDEPLFPPRPGDAEDESR
jgi:hypothetical protein